MLAPGECESVHDWVDQQRPRWERRHPRLSFFTLGAVSHLDAENGRAEFYQAKARELNGFLWDGLAWLYRRFADTLGRTFDVPFFYDDFLALPGFHIFLDPAFSCSGAGRHFDLEHQLIDWARYQDVEVDRKLSLTLAIRLPASGAGIWL